MCAVNQMMKATAIARNYLVDDHLELVATPSFVEIPAGEKVHSAIRLSVRVYRRLQDS
jgi:stage V sporulation protein SpoVS